MNGLASQAKYNLRNAKNTWGEKKSFGRLWSIAWNIYRKLNCGFTPTLRNLNLVELYKKGKKEWQLRSTIRNMVLPLIPKTTTTTTTTTKT